MDPRADLDGVEKRDMLYIRYKQLKSSVYTRVFLLRAATTKALGTAGLLLSPQKCASSIQELGITSLLAHLPILPD